MTIKIPLQKKKRFFIKDFFRKCDQIRRKLRVWSHLLKKSLMENLFFVQCTPLLVNAITKFPVLKVASYRRTANQQLCKNSLLLGRYEQFSYDI